MSFVARAYRTQEKASPSQHLYINKLSPWVHSSQLADGARQVPPQQDAVPNAAVCFLGVRNTTMDQSRVRAYVRRRTPLEVDDKWRRGVLFERRFCVDLDVSKDD